MTAIDLDDGGRIFASAGSSPAEVKRQFAARETVASTLLQRGRRSLFKLT
jgi:hypothetical protein